MTEDETVGGHHRHNGHEFEQALGIGDGQGSLAFLQGRLQEFLQSMESQRVRQN